MIWSPQQYRALSTVAKWIKSQDQQICRLFGYAGTGKTTLARHLIDGVSGQVLFAAYTGKAAHVMRSKGCHDASTIHRLIYRAEDVFVCPDHPDDTYGTDTQGCRRCERPLVRRPRFTLNRDSPLSSASLLIVDECSMVDESLGRDLMSFGRPILVLGDPFQLPPPEGCGFFTGAKPDIMLTEIHRQRRDNPIIRMSMDIRDGKPLRYGEYGGSHIVASWQEMQESTADVDQYIVGRNTTRMYVNRQMCKDRLAGPLPGDRLVCLRNNNQMGLLNGEQFLLDRVDKISKDGTMALYVKSDDRSELDYVVTHRQFFECAKVEEAHARVGGYGIDEFCYGYALTAHKSQGSQWDHVVVSDESRRFEEPQRWLYTAITRAKESVTIITGLITSPASPPAPS